EELVLDAVVDHAGRALGEPTGLLHLDRGRRRYRDDLGVGHLELGTDRGCTTGDRGVADLAGVDVSLRQRVRRSRRDGLAGLQTAFALRPRAVGEGRKTR